MERYFGNWKSNDSCQFFYIRSLGGICGDLIHHERHPQITRDSASPI